MHKSVFGTLLVGLTILLSAGCMGESTPPPTNVEIAQSAKQRMDSFVETALKNPKQAAGDLEILMESLDGYARDYGGGFVELRDIAKATIPEVRNAKSKLELEAALGKLQGKMNELASPPTN